MAGARKFEPGDKVWIKSHQTYDPDRNGDGSWKSHPRAPGVVKKKASMRDWYQVRNLPSVSSHYYPSAYLTRRT